MLPGLIAGLLPIFDKVLTRFIPDPEARQKAIGELFGMLQASDLAQMEVNKAEAASSSIFVAGWRPAIGWICAAALAYQFLIAPMVLWGTAIAGIYIGQLPTLDDHLWELLFGLLGMGALRSLEKLKGVAR